MVHDIGTFTWLIGKIEAGIGTFARTIGTIRELIGIETQFNSFTRINWCASLVWGKANTLVFDICKLGF